MATKKDTLHISGFKCFDDKRLELGKITLLTGSNGSGKSSVLQAILLLRQIVEKHNEQKTAEDTIEIELNGYHRLQLGSYDDIINKNSNKDCAGIGMNNTMFNINYGGFPGKAVVTSKADAIENLPPFITSKNFHYLNAERTSPRIDYEIKTSDVGNCGDMGEYAGNILLNAGITAYKIDDNRIMESADDTAKVLNLVIQADRWMSYIFSEVSVKPEKITEYIYRVKLRRQHTVIAPNTGFGYTYALPIIINGLIANRGDAIIVENPEAHLHPKAQSNMGFFLGRMAAAGSRVIIETHSEHIVNGVRRAALSGNGLEPSDIGIYFFNDKQHDCRLITVDEDGNMSDFPVDFFDQTRQDILEIMRLAAKRKGE